MPQISIDNKTIESECLILDPKEKYFLGPELTLRNCTLVLRVPARDLNLISPRLIDCTIEVKRELKSSHWYYAHLKGCRFTGSLTGVDFGSWPDWPDEGSIADCDFSEARLNGCRFIGCDASTLRFPRWPYFTILDPMRRLDEMRQLPWPGQTRALVEIIANSPPEMAAVTHHATSVAKDWGATEEQLKAALAHLDGVIL